jgi:hypothetical protein
LADIEDKEAVITIKVKLESEVTGLEGATGQEQHDPFLNDVSPNMQETINQQVQDTVDDIIGDSLQETLGGTTNVENLTDMVKQLDKQGISELTQFAKSPQGYLEHGLIRLIGMAGPHGALVLAIIAAVLASPELFKAMIEMLAVKGGPLNQDFRYSLDEQENQQFDRVFQYSRLVGGDPIIRVSTKGYIVGDPDFVGSSLIDANIARTARIGLRESSLGVIDGI